MQKCCRAGLNIVIDGVSKLIELIGTTGGAFGRLSPQVTRLTAGFLLGAFFLVGSFVLLHRLQTIQLEGKAREFELRQLEAQGRQEVRARLAPGAPRIELSLPRPPLPASLPRVQLEITKMMVPFMRLPDGVGSTTAGLHYGNRNFSIEITASDEVRRAARAHSLALHCPPFPSSLPSARRLSAPLPSSLTIPSHSSLAARTRHRAGFGTTPSPFDVLPRASVRGWLACVHGERDCTHAGVCAAEAGAAFWSERGR